MPKIMYRVASTQEVESVDTSRLSIARCSIPDKYNAGDLLVSFSGKSYKEIYKQVGGANVAVRGYLCEFYCLATPNLVIRRVSAEGCYRVACQYLDLFEV